MSEIRSPKKLDPTQVFHHAQIYHASAIIMLREATGGGADKRVTPDYFFPMIAMSALASEIYLKSLLAMKYDGAIPNKIQRNHNLRELFDALSDPKVEGVIEKHWDAMRDKNPTFQIRSSPFVGADTSLRASLTAGASAFQRYRYVYEGQLVDFPLERLPDVLRDAIRELRPDMPVHAPVSLDREERRVKKDET